MKNGRERSIQTTAITKKAWKGKIRKKAAERQQRTKQEGSKLM